MLIEQIIEFEKREPGPPSRIVDVGVLNVFFPCIFPTVLPLPTIQVWNLAFSRKIYKRLGPGLEKQDILYIAFCNIFNRKFASEIFVLSWK